MSCQKLGQMLEKPCIRSGGHIFSLIIMKLCLTAISDEFEKEVIVRSKTRSLGQMLEKPCVSSRGHIISLITMKLGQNVCLADISYEFENRSCGVKD